MRNLELLYSRTVELPISNVQHINVSTESVGTTFIATSDQLLNFDWTTVPASATTAPPPPPPQTNPIVTLEHPIVGFELLTVNNELCVATEAGEVIVYNLQQQQQQQPIGGDGESVTFCEGGLRAMAWSNDQEVVAFVTQANALVVMNSVYDVIAEQNLLADDFGDAAFINVGWGKKETQFHGSEGKQAAQKPVDNMTDEIHGNDSIDAAAQQPRVQIVWRGDDELFAVSFVGGAGRMFKVFDKEGKLKSTSERLVGLSDAIAWRPSGNWIAIPHRLPNKYTVGLFEKNGLRHREIVLPFKMDDERVEKLAWSSDSDVLAIYTERSTGGSNIYLYTICNYHWYQKQTLHFNEKCVAIEWDGNFSEGKTLHVIETNARYSVWRWTHSIDRSRGAEATDQAVVAVIDGNSLLLTNFRGAVIPPPMCAVTLSHATQINHIDFIRQSTDSNRFFIVDGTNTFTTYACTFQCQPEKNINLLESVKPLNTFKFDLDEGVPRVPHHWIWFDEQQVIFCQNQNDSTIISLATLADDRINVHSEQIVDGIVVNVIVSMAGQNCATPKIMYQLMGGRFEAIDTVDGMLQPPNHLFDVNGLCERIDCATGNGRIAKLIALANQQNLYVDGEKVESNVTSFLCTEQFILFTTLDQLKFIRLSTTAAAAAAATATPTVINGRRIERGGQLITTVPHDSRVVLQMPRGNLETIQPRVLSLVIIGELLDAHHYGKAFDLLRKQRINLNLLVDHNPADFLCHTSEFITDIDKIQWLNLFLSELQNDDVTLTMYASNYQHLLDRTTGGIAPAIFNESNQKIDVICERFCVEFEKHPTTKYLLPIITALVKQKHLDKALQLLWRVRRTELEATADASVAGQNGVAVSAHDALKYLLYLVNVNDLYDVALGMYDFDLVLFVAQKSQKDPKEYVPFLNELKQLEENYRKYRIDMHLKRYDKALGHIVKCGVEKLEECLDLIEKHGLYAQALRSFKPNDECYNDVVIQYADHLRAQRAFFEASLMYERGGDFKQAMLSAKHTLDWRKCQRLAIKCAHTANETERLCMSLLPALRENDRFGEAADLVQYFHPHSDELIKVLCDGRFYHRASTESVTMTTPNDQFEFIRNHLNDFAGQTIQKIHSDHEQFQTHVDRLQTIRKQRSEKQLNGGDGDGDDDCDMFSDTTSMNSSRFTGGSRASTARTFRSSKSKRKHERKLLSLKEGNPFEDIALIDAVYNLIQHIYGQQQHIGEHLKCLVDMELDACAREIQQKFGELLERIKQTVDSVWLPEMIVSGEIKAEEYMDYLHAQNQQHYVMIKPHQRVKPLLTSIDWQLEILK